MLRMVARPRRRAVTDENIRLERARALGGPFSCLEPGWLSACRPTSSTSSSGSRRRTHVPTADLTPFETAVVEVAGNVVGHGVPCGMYSTFAFSVLPDRIEVVLSAHGWR
jgi:hypothetical protein